MKGTITMLTANLRRAARMAFLLAMASVLAACGGMYSRAPIPNGGNGVVTSIGGTNYLSVARPSGPAIIEARTATPDIDPAAAPPTEINWRDHFSDISQGAILIQIDKRRLSYWAPGARSYRDFPIAVPRNPSLERRGETRIVRRRKNPDWRPTPDMLKRNPNLPAYVGPGPNNPLGRRALYLGWRYYAIHGTNSPDSIGRATTSGCFRLFDEHIEWLFDNAVIGTPVKVVDKV